MTMKTKETTRACTCSASQTLPCNCQVFPVSFGNPMWPHVIPSLSLSPTMAADVQAAIQRASHLNKEGISSLVSGDVETGFSCFRTALDQLEQMKLYVLVSSQAQTSTGHFQAPGANLFGAAGPVLEAVDLHSMSLSHESDYMYVYDNALDFLPDLERRLLIQEDTLGFQVYFYSAIVMFNIGICLHLHGIHRNNEGMLVTAVHFYDMSMQIIAGIPILEYSDKLMMIMLSIWNNQSQIYYQLGSYEHAVEVLDGVKRLSARLLLERQTTLDPVDQEHIQEFVLNVITMRVPTTAATA